MEMQAVTNQFSMEEAAILAVEAGNDMVLVSHTQELQEKAFWAVVEAVKKGRIPEERINESLARIAAAKQRFVKWPFPDKSVGSPENQALMEDAYGDSITVVKGSEHIPLPDVPITVIEVKHCCIPCRRASRRWLQSVSGFVRFGGRSTTVLC